MKRNFKDWKINTNKVYIVTSLIINCYFQQINPSAFYWRTFALLLASKKRVATSYIYSFVIYDFPFVFAKTHAGVTNWTQYLKDVFDPIYPKWAKAYGDNFIFSVEALIAKIFINSSNP